MTSQPTSGPGSGLIASKQTAITSAQILALFTTPVVVSPAPRADQILVPIWWVAVATNSATAYVNGMGGNLSLTNGGTYDAGSVAVLLSELTSGNPSFLASRPLGGDSADLTGVAGAAVQLALDTGNLTAGNFGITFTLFYTTVPST